MTVRLDLEYRLYRGLSLTVAPGFVVFFEKGAPGLYPVADIGLRYAF